MEFLLEAHCWMIEKKFRLFALMENLKVVRGAFRGRLCSDSRKAVFIMRGRSSKTFSEIANFQTVASELYSN
jgi:hypothetical protein